MLSLFADTGAAAVRSPIEPEPAQAEEPVVSETAAAEPAGNEPIAGGPAEYEVVLGRRHMAGVLFLAIFVVVIFSTLSYIAGKSINGWSAAAPATPQLIAGPPIPMVRATLAPPALPAPIAQRPLPQLPAAPVRPVAAGEGPALFADPIPHQTYIQMAAVEKGVAAIFAEGLRSHGLESFAAPGPNERIFRVLIGPLADDAAYKRAKSIVDQIGLSTFMKRYQE
jgi:cell division septation protein DedD